MLDVFFQLFSKDFGYYGMIYSPTNWLHEAASYLFPLIIALFIPIHIKKPSEIILLLLFIFCYVPAATVFSMNSNHPIIAFYGLSIFLFLVVLLQQVNFLSKWNANNYLLMQDFQFRLSAVFAILLMLTVAYYGLTLKWVSFDEVYDVRAEYMEQGNRLIGYLYGWLTHAITIALLLIALNQKRYYLALLVALIQVYLYTLGAHKSVLLMLPFVFWIWIGVKLMQRYLALYVLGGIFLITAILFVFDSYQYQYSNASSVFIRRNLLLPAQIYFHYVEYFSLYYADYFAQNFPFSLFYQTNYSEKLPELIGKKYFTFKENVYANGNIFADLFANLGNASFIVGAILLSALLKAFDLVAKNKNPLFVLPLAAVSIVTLSNSGFIVNLVTHGILVMLLVLRFYPKTMFRLKYFKQATTHG